MKIKKNLEISTSDFWYDLMDGGYLNPDEILEDKSDASKVIDAINLLMNFSDSCDEQIEGFSQ